MAIKGVAQVVDIAWESATTFQATIRVVSLDSFSVQTNFTMGGLDPSALTSFLFQSAIRNAAKQELINNGISFGLLDGISLVGASLL